MMKTDYSLIPENLMKNLWAYVRGEEAPTSFLYAILTNNLFKSMVLADSVTRPIIPLLVQYIHWEVPGLCHGSPEHVKNWMEEQKKQKEHLQKIQ